MKNLTNILQRSNLSPKDRILACIHDEVERARTGKRILSDADVVAISKNWKPKHNTDTDEYNRYHESWDMIRCLRIDAQTSYLNTALALETASSLCMLCLHPNDHLKKYLPKSIDDEYITEVFSKLLENTGLEYKLLEDNEEVDSLIDEGKLTLKKVITYSQEERREDVIITGESIYSLEQEYEFANDFKKQLKDLMFFACLVENIKRNKDFTSHYGSMLYMRKILEQASSLFETNLTFYVDVHLSETNQKIDLLNLELKEVLRNLLEEIYSTATYPIAFSPDDFYFSIDDIKPRKDPSFEELIRKVNNIWSLLGRNVLEI
jgi:predicted nucleotidyltransferase